MSCCDEMHQNLVGSHLVFLFICNQVLWGCSRGCSSSIFCTVHFITALIRAGTLIFLKTSTVLFKSFFFCARYPAARQSCCHRLLSRTCDPIPPSSRRRYKYKPTHPWCPSKQSLVTMTLSLYNPCSAITTDKYINPAKSPNYQSNHSDLESSRPREFRNFGNTLKPLKFESMRGPKLYVYSNKIMKIFYMVDLLLSSHLTL